MILFLGMSADAGDFQPINSQDDYPVADLLAVLPEVWWGSSYDPPIPAPLWVASDNELLAEGASSNWGGIPIYTLDANGFPVAPAP